jgi:hypothetical protein
MKDEQSGGKGPFDKLTTGKGGKAARKKAVRSSMSCFSLHPSAFIL